MLVTSIRHRKECDDGTGLLQTGNRLYSYSGNRKFADSTDDAGIRNTRDANTPLFLHNTTASVGKWIGVKVLGSASNADALGAKITVTPTEGGDVMKAFVGTTGSFLTQDGASEHFGLNDFKGKIW